MGDPKKRKKVYQKPRKSFQKENIVKERETKQIYGLKNKKEYYRAESIIRTKRKTARTLLALDLEQRLRREKELLDSLIKQGILRGTPTLEDVLVLTPESILERRLQTIVWRKGLANTAKQARQFIVHGHVSVNGNKIDKPNYLVKVDEENNIKYYKKELLLEHKKHEKPQETKDESETSKLQKDFEEVKENQAKDESKNGEENKKEEISN